MLLRIGYTRLSREEQDRGQTMAQQVDLLERWGFDELYQDVESGRYDDRKNFVRMVDRAREAAAQGYTVEIRVARDDRWGRSLSLVALVEELERLGIRVYSRERGHISTATASDWKVTASEALEAESYSRRLSDNVRRGMAYKRQQMQPLGGQPPWGYKLVDKVYAPDPENWDKARATVDRFLQGGSLRQVALWMFESYEKKWSGASLRSWLRNPALAGHTRYSVNGYSQADRRRSVNPATVPKRIVYNTHPPLITEAERHEITKRLDDNKRLGQGHAKRLYAVTTTYCFCAACGKRCRMQGAAPRRYLRCSDEQCEGWQRPTIRDSVVEAAIQNAIAEAAEAIATEALEGEDAIDPRVAAWEAEVKALEPLAHRPGIAAEIEAIRQEISNAKATRGYRVASEEEFRNLVIAVSKFSPQQWALLSTEERRVLYRDLIGRVEILRGEIISVRLNG